MRKSRWYALSIPHGPISLKPDVRQDETIDEGDDGSSVFGDSSSVTKPDGREYKLTSSQANDLGLRRRQLQNRE